MEYCGRCYKICNNLDNPSALHSARVQYGIAKSHQFMGEFSQLMQEGSVQDSVHELVAWKDARVNPFVLESEGEEEEVEEEEVEEDEEEEEDGEEEQEDRSDGEGTGEVKSSSEQESHPP